MCFSDGMEIWDWWHIVVEYGTLPISGFVIVKWRIFHFKGFKDGNFQKIYPSKFYYVVNKLVMANISDIMIWNNDSKIFICRKGLDLVNFCYMNKKMKKEAQHVDCIQNDECDDINKYIFYVYKLFCLGFFLSTYLIEL